MPKDGWDSDLSYTGEYEQLPDPVAGAKALKDFWEIVTRQLSYGNIPDAYPFNWEGSEELKDNPPHDEKGPNPCAT